MGQSFDTITRVLLLAGMLGFAPVGVLWGSGAGVSPGFVRSGQALAEERGETLVAYDGPRALAPAYRLPVVAVAELPPEAQRTAGPEYAFSGPRSSCPVQVRAIVMASGGGESFAVVADGEDSRLLHRGEGARLGHSYVALTRIQPGTIGLQRGGISYTCELAKP